MAVNDLLTAEHARLRKSVAEIQAAFEKSPSAAGDIFLRFKDAVRLHFRREDEVYFKILDDGKRISNRELMHDIRNDHAAVVFALESLAIKIRKQVPVAEWKPKFDHMISFFLPHLDQEEKELFPEGARILAAEQMNQILEDMQNLPEQQQ